MNTLQKIILAVVFVILIILVSQVVTERYKVYINCSKCADSVHTPDESWPTEPVVFEADCTDSESDVEICDSD